MAFGPAASANLFVYPRSGQSAAQQETDTAECHLWAVQQSGFNPFAGSGGRAQTGGIIGGGATGAAVGAVGGAIGGNAGRGAAIGAGTGALLGGMRQHNHNRNVNSMNSQMQRAYNRAITACLEGRGYSVS